MVEKPIANPTILAVVSVLHEIEKMEAPPPLIVASRVADTRVWAEVVNLGG